MKIQTSLEFILILSAIALLGLGVISMYGRSISTQYASLSSAMNRTQAFGQSPPEADPEAPQVFISVPGNSTLLGVGDIQLAFYGCSYGVANVTLSSPSSIFPKNRSQVQVSDIAVASLEFEPLAEGANWLTVNYTIKCGNATAQGSKSLLTFAEPTGHSGQNGIYAASLSGRDEKLEYGMGTPVLVPQLTEFSHCTYNNYWSGQPLPVSSQCGTSDAWTYMVFSDYCYYNTGSSMTSTECIVPAATGYSTVATSQTPEYSYSFELALSLQPTVLRSAISSSVGRSAAMLDNSTVGYAEVTSASYSGTSQGPTMMGSNGKYVPVNESAYAQYQQALENLDEKLSYYNQTSVDGPTQSAIEQAVSSFNKASNILVESGPGNSTCAISGNVLECTPAGLFTYTINVNISKITVQNQTLYAQGSQINVLGG